MAITSGGCIAPANPGPTLLHYFKPSLETKRCGNIQVFCSQLDEFRGMCWEGCWHIVCEIYFAWSPFLLFHNRKLKEYLVPGYKLNNLLSNYAFERRKLGMRWQEVQSVVKSAWNCGKHLRQHTGAPQKVCNIFGRFYGWQRKLLREKGDRGVVEDRRKWDENWTPCCKLVIEQQRGWYGAGHRCIHRCT